MQYKFNVKYTPETIAQIKHIVKWYNKQQDGLGQRFKTNLKAVIKATKENPYTHSFRYDNVRCAIVKKFPYAAHYTIDEDNKIIIIHAIFGFAQDYVKEEK